MQIRSNVLLCLLVITSHSFVLASSIDSIDAQIKKAQGMIYKNPVNAEEIALVAKAESESENYLKGSGNAFRVIGLSYFIRGDYDIAIDNLLNSFSIFEQLNDSLKMGHVLGNLGVVYKNLKDYEQSIEYYERALGITKLEDTLGLSKLYNNIGVVKQRLNEHGQAKEYFYQSLELKKALGNQKGISNTLTNLGNASIKLGQLEDGLKYFKSSMAIEKQLNHAEGLAKNYNNIAALFLKMDEYDSAMSYAFLALKIGKELETKVQIKEAASALAVSYEHFGNYKSALEFKTLEIAMRDSMNNEDVARKLGKLESKLELIKKQNAIENLTLNNSISKIEIEKKKLQVLWLIISLIITFIAAIIVVRLIYIRFKLKRQLHMAEINELRIQVKTILEGDTSELGLDAPTLNSKLNEPLSEREFEILEYAISDLNNSEIAEKVFVSVNTVKFHLKNVYNKLGVSNRKQALEYVIKSK